MIPRMRTINEAAEELRQIDPHTAVTPYMIRQMVLSGKLPHVKAGKKRLISLDALMEYLNAPPPVFQVIKPGTIQPISERRA